MAFDGSEIVALSRVREGTGVQRFARGIDLGGAQCWNPASGLVMTATGEAIVSGDFAQVDGSIRAYLARSSTTGAFISLPVRTRPAISQTVDLALAGGNAFTAAENTPVIRPIVLRDAR